MGSISPAALSNNKIQFRYRVLGILTLLTMVIVVAALMRLVSPADPLAEARGVLKGPATISIIGDSTGNDLSEWVGLWAADLGRDRKVTMHCWLDGRYRPDPVTYGTGGDVVTIWNASQPGGVANWASGQLTIVQPERPDLIILNVGHNNTQANVDTQLEQLRLGLDERVPVVLILQNPGRGVHKDRQAATLRAAARWANNHQVPTIDVGAAFTDPQNQLRDDVHPNETGSRIWAETVAKALSS